MKKFKRLFIVFGLLGVFLGWSGGAWAEFGKSSGTGNCSGTNVPMSYCDAAKQTCWDGSFVFSPASCPPDTRATCWDGSKAMSQLLCPADTRATCWDGSKADNSSLCPLDTRATCWDGSKSNSPVDCPVDTRATCWDGSKAANQSSCPAQPLVTCWNRSQAVNQSDCPVDTRVTCWDGSKAIGYLQCLNGVTCPDGTKAQNFNACPGGHYYPNCDEKLQSVCDAQGYPAYDQCVLNGDQLIDVACPNSLPSCDASSLCPTDYFKSVMSCRNSDGSFGIKTCPTTVPDPNLPPQIDCGNGVTVTSPLACPPPPQPQIDCGNGVTVTPPLACPDSTNSGSTGDTTGSGSTGGTTGSGSTGGTTGSGGDSTESTGSGSTTTSCPLPYVMSAGNCLKDCGAGYLPALYPSQCTGSTGSGSVLNPTGSGGDSTGSSGSGGGTGSCQQSNFTDSCYNSVVFSLSDGFNTCPLGSHRGYLEKCYSDTSTSNPDSTPTPTPTSNPSSGSGSGSTGDTTGSGSTGGTTGSGSTGGTTGSGSTGGTTGSGSTGGTTGSSSSDSTGSGSTDNNTSSTNNNSSSGVISSGTTGFDSGAGVKSPGSFDAVTFDSSLPKDPRDPKGEKELFRFMLEAPSFEDTSKRWKFTMESTNDFIVALKNLRIFSSSGACIPPSFNLGIFSGYNDLVFDYPFVFISKYEVFFRALSSFIFAVTALFIILSA